MFVARLLAALKTPHTHLGLLDDTLVLDVDRYRAALLHLVRLLSDEGAVDDATAAWTFTCIADGWVDEHLANVRDGLLELGAVKDQAHLDRLLMAATHHILGCGPGTPAHGLVVSAEGSSLTVADALLLQTVTQAMQAAESDHEPLGLRLLVRRYALELGLLTRTLVAQTGAAEPTLTVVRTPLGDAVLALPHPYVLTFLLSLELLQSAGPSDRWRTPQSALGHMQAQAQFLVATTAQARRSVDPGGLLPWRRIRRLHLLGVCEPVLRSEETEESRRNDEGRTAYPYRLSAIGANAIALVLAEPHNELRELAEFLLTERAQAAVGPLLRRAPVVEPKLTASHDLLPVPLLRISERQNSGSAVHPSAASRAPVRDAMAAEPATKKSAPVRPPGSGPASVPWRLEGPLAAFPVTSAAFSESMLSEALLGSAAESAERAKFGAITFNSDDEHGSSPAVSPSLPPVSKPPSSGSGGEASSRQEIDLRGLIQRAWAELQVARVHFALLGPTVYAVGERRALLQAWRELLRSAADAALQGAHSPPLVTVELDPSAEAVQILVHDSGPPLTQGDAAALELNDYGAECASREPGAALPYVDSGKLHPVEGTRRGLWLAQRTLSEQGALLALSTPQLGGTTVRITLPHPPRPLRTAA